MLPIYKKEMRTYFSQMIGYLFITFFLLIIGIFFVFTCISGAQGMASPQFQSVLSGITILFVIYVPVLTMRLFAEETRHKTDQLLFTSPLSVGQIVLGKFLAALSLFGIAIVISFILPLMLSLYGALPMSEIIGAYLGYFLLGSCFISIGLFISVMTDNQIIAAIATFAMVFGLNIIDGVAMILPMDTRSSMIFVALIIIGVAYILYNSTKNVILPVIVSLIGVVAAVVMFFINDLIYDGVIVKTLQWFSVFTRYENFMNGIINLSDVVYYLSFTALFIYLAINVIEKRRWR